MNASKPATPILTRPASSAGVDKAVPKSVAWGSMRDNRGDPAKHPPPKGHRAPSGAVVDDQPILATPQHTLRSRETLKAPGTDERNLIVSTLLKILNENAATPTTT